MSRGCITLLTDFGTTDPYVAAMKGAALSVNPDVQLVDVSHEVAPHDVAEAGYLLAYSYRHFAAGTVHVAVVDPGVGSERRILAAEVEGQVLMAPDNGLLSLALGERPAARLVNVTSARFFRHPVSLTFHGRDIFAPVAAHLTLGVDLGELGPPVADYERFEAGAARATAEGLEGRVIHVDHFGSLVTNITREQVAALGPDAHPRVHLEGTQIGRILRTYSDVRVGALLAVVGSAGLLEISANRRSAADLLGVGRGTVVRVTRGAERP